MAVDASSVKLRIPADVSAAIRDTALRTNQDFADVANQMLSEAVKMRRVPGIVFADEPSGRRPWIAGTGLEVFEILDAYRNMGEHRERLRQAFHWLRDDQLQAAFDYAETYPEEVEAWFREAGGWDVEDLWAKYPATKPP